MKKIFILSVILLASIFLFSSCSCKHENLSKANCTQRETCLDCGEVFGSALGHTEGKWIVDKEATCTENGSKHQICSTCNGTIKTETLEKLGHTEVIDKAVSPTCLATGLTEGKHCSTCNVILQKQTTVNKSDHSDEKGTCTVCKKVTDPYLALAYYIMENGIKTGNTYLIYKDETSEDYKRDTTYIGFDSEKLEFILLKSTETSSGKETSISITLDLESNYQLVQMTQTAWDGGTDRASGEINAHTFNTNNPYVYDFKCNNSMFASIVKMDMLLETSLMLLNCELILQETHTGITMSMLGFKNLI